MAQSTIRTGNPIHTPWSVIRSLLEPRLCFSYVESELSKQNVKISEESLFRCRRLPFDPKFGNRAEVSSHLPLIMGRFKVGDRLVSAPDSWAGWTEIIFKSYGMTQSRGAILLNCEVSSVRKSAKIGLSPLHMLSDITFHFMSFFARRPPAP
jgi:hypothetical protein